MSYYRPTAHCPNCYRDFYANVDGEYCAECWDAWCRNDGTFEKRTKTLADWVSENRLTATEAEQ